MYNKLNLMDMRELVGNKLFSKMLQQIAEATACNKIRITFKRHDPLWFYITNIYESK